MNTLETLLDFYREENWDKFAKNFNSLIVNPATFLVAEVRDISLERKNRNSTANFKDIIENHVANIHNPDLNKIVSYREFITDLNYFRSFFTEMFETTAQDLDNIQNSYQQLTELASHVAILYNQISFNFNEIYDKADEKVGQFQSYMHMYVHNVYQAQLSMSGGLHAILIMINKVDELLRDFTAQLKSLEE